MKQFFALILLAITIEGTVTYIRTWFVDNHFQWQQVLTCALGIFLAIAYQLDYLHLFEVDSTIPYVGIVLTGIAISRGSNYVFDLLKKLSTYQSGELITEVKSNEVEKG